MTGDNGNLRAVPALRAATAACAHGPILARRKAARCVGLDGPLRAIPPLARNAAAFPRQRKAPAPNVQTDATTEVDEQQEAPR